MRHQQGLSLHSLSISLPPFSLSPFLSFNSITGPSCLLLLHAKVFTMSVCPVSKAYEYLPSSSPFYICSFLLHSADFTLQNQTHTSLTLLPSLTYNALTYTDTQTHTNSRPPSLPQTSITAHMSAVSNLDWR